MAHTIVERIEADAAAQARQIVDAAKEKAEAKLDAARAQAEEIAATEARRAEADAAEVLRRRGMLASLEVKKLDLAGRRDVLDAAFARASEKLGALSETEYEDFIARLIARYSEYGDKIVLSAQKTVDRSFVMALPEYESKTLRLEREAGDFAGGIVLIGKTYDKRLTFEELLAEIKPGLEPLIADELFGE